MSPRPRIIAHRGASGYRPEHTLEAYALAIAQGADFIEPDVVATRDGVLVVRHENEISGTTDVAAHPELADRRTTKTVDGREVCGWFTEDLSLEELRTLRATERLPFRSHSRDGCYRIPTLPEVVDLVRGESARLRRPIGICPETKHPSYFASIGLPLEPSLVNVLEGSGCGGVEVPVFLQSFETENLRTLRGRTGLPLVQLLGETEEPPWDLACRGDPRRARDLATPAGLREIATYAAAVGCHKRLIVPAGAGGRLLPPTTLVDDAHAVGLEVHVWTFRNEAVFLAPDYGDDADRELEQFIRLGVDGLFTDFPDTAVRVRTRVKDEDAAKRRG